MARPRNRGFMRAGRGLPGELNYNQQAVALTGLMWYIPMSGMAGITSWPSQSALISGDYAVTWGTPYVTDWTNESGLVPANYNSAITSLGGVLWYSELDELQP